MDRHYPGWAADMHWTTYEALHGLMARTTRAATVAIASRTRAVHARLGLVRGGRAGIGEVAATVGASVAAAIRTATLAASHRVD